MTKYMKIKTVLGHSGRVGESLYIDLYKINNIREAANFNAVSLPYGCEQSLTDEIEDVYTSVTNFTAPGKRNGYTVNGTAPELIAHIELQQKHARKGLPVEPYEPEVKLYTANGEVSRLNQTFKRPDGWKTSSGVTRFYMKSAQ
jgi:hypothetical protein